MPAKATASKDSLHNKFGEAVVTAPKQFYNIRPVSAPEKAAQLPVQFSGFAAADFPILSELHHRLSGWNFTI